jgi:hypothetical protein
MNYQPEFRRLPDAQVRHNSSKISEKLLIGTPNLRGGLFAVVHHRSIRNEEVDVRNRSEASQIDEIGSARPRSPISAKPVIGLIY